MMKHAWFPEFSNIPPAELEGIKMRFKQVFATEIGQDVLTSILALLKFYSQADRPEDMELQNVAKKILFLSGAWEDGKESLITNRLMGGK